MGATRLWARIIARLAQAEACESNLHYRDDLQIAKLTVLYASTGEAVYCTPDVLATYNVLGCHPDKVWSKIERQREALGDPEKVLGWKLPPKKPPQSAVGFSHVKLWCENTNGARAVNSRAAKAFDLGDQTRSVPMAAPSIAALYPNPAGPSSAKKRQFTLEELQHIVRYSGAPVSVRDLTLAALQARGPWPKQQGPATPIICVSIKGMQIEAGVVRSTIQRRIKRARQDQYWNRVRETNSWNDCPKCSTPRESSKCGKCNYQGSRKNKGEYSPAFTYELNVERFLAAPRCREIHSVNWRTYAEYKEAAKRGEHPNVTEMPARPDPEQTPPPKSPAPAKREEPIRKTALHQRESARNQKLSKTEAARFVGEMIALMKGQGEAPGRTEPDPDCNRCHGEGRVLSPAHPGQMNRCWCWSPPDPHYRAPMPQKEAIAELCKRWHRESAVVVEALKFWGYTLQLEE